MTTHYIGVIPGDGTGPEVTNEALKVLKVTADKYNFKQPCQQYRKLHKYIVSVPISYSY